MKSALRFTFGLASCVLAALILTGCNKPTPKIDPDDTPQVRQGEKGPNEPPPGSGEVLKNPLESVIEGRVELVGTAPVMASRVDQMEKDPSNKKCCVDTAPPEDKVWQTWRVSKDGGVDNVIVFLVPPKGKTFAKKDPEKPDAIINQPHCQYHPHVQVVLPGQQLVFENTATVNHNVKFEGRNIKGNLAQPPGDVKKLSVTTEKKPVEIICDSHKWMSGYVWPTDNPYTVVTDPDGKFVLKDVPTGVELEVRFWHESTGTFTTAEKLMTKKGDNKVTIKLKAPG